MAVVLRCRRVRRATLALIAAVVLPRSLLGGESFLLDNLSPKIRAAAGFLVPPTAAKPIRTARAGGSGSRTFFSEIRTYSSGGEGPIPEDEKRVASRKNNDDAPRGCCDLKDCVCLVTGASRGIGKGIALELGKAGATVYVTGTSSSSSSSQIKTRSQAPSPPSPYATSELVGGPGTIEETAQLVTEAGGLGIPVRCNHAVDDDVKRLFQTIRERHGRLDILVNNVFRVPGGPDALYGKFWEQGPAVWDCVHTVGLRSHYVASCYAVPLLLQSKSLGRSQKSDDGGNSQKKKSRSATGLLPRPLIVMISSFGGLAYTFNVAYGVGKAGVDRLARDMAAELAPEGVCVVSLWPGVVATERTAIAVEAGDWDRFVGLPLDNCESPEFTGRAVKAIALDPDSMRKTGSCQVVAELAEEYGFTDVDGRRPPSIRSLRFLLPTYGMSAELRSKIPAKLIPDWKLPFWVMAQGAPPPPPQRADK